MERIPFSVRAATWRDDEQALRSIRHPVFVVEQKIATDEEFDELDKSCRHFLAVDENSNPIGTCRLEPSFKIGRVAVLMNWRGSGVGRALVRKAVDAAQLSGARHVYLYAQVIAAPFYAKEGFVSYGDQFTESGIEHIAMKREL